MMENKLSGFDKQLRDTYENHEAPYEPAHWQDLSRELDIMAPTSFKYFRSITTGIAATGLVFLVMLFLLADVEKKPSQLVEIEIIEETEGADTASVASKTGALAENDSQISETSETEFRDAGSAAANTESVSLSKEKNSQSKIAAVSKIASEKPVETANAAKSAEPKADEGKNIHRGCTGLTIQFEAGEQYGKDAKYLWNFGDGYFSNDRNPSHTFNRAGTFDVSLSVTSYTKGQITSNVVQGSIHVEEAPMAQIEADLSAANQVVFKNKSYRASDSEWIVNGKEQSGSGDLNIMLSDNTHFEVQLAAFSKMGCVDTLDVKLNKEENARQITASLSMQNADMLNPEQLFEGKVVNFRFVDKNSGKITYDWASRKNSQKPSASGPGVYKWICLTEKNNTYTVYTGEVELK